jgi:hypothetical protein
MTGLNHAATGALVAVVIKQPAIALPAALLSHFMIDSLPHWNYWLPGQRRFRQWVIYSDMALSLALLAFLATFQISVEWWIVLSAGLIAILPDMMWFPYLILGKNTPADTNSWLHRLRRFHLRIQWSETPHGIYYELLWFTIMLTLFFSLA